MSYQTYLNPKNPVVTIKVKDMGTITLELFPEVAPNTVHNFIALANRHFYDGLIFHRIIPNFMIQGGWGKEELRPIRERYEKLVADKAYLESCYRKADEIALKISSRTMGKVMKKIGFI